MSGRPISRQFALVSLVCGLAAFGETRDVDPPSMPRSGMPNFAVTAKGDVYLSWIDTLGEKDHALRYARWTGTQWGPAETIAKGSNWFVNWADFASLDVLDNGTMLAHWLTKAESDGKYGYGIRVAKREAKGAPWRQIHGMSLEEKSDYAGFLTFVPGRSGAIYLSPPPETGQAEAAHDHHEGHRKTVRFVTFRPDGTLEADKELDADACSCCQTAVGRTPHGLIAAYRDHLPGEIRDISIVRFSDGVWTRPETLHPDGWRINGCPTDGPAISTAGRRVGIVWLTRAADVPKVQLALSSDEGKRFQLPLRIDSGNPLGRPSITVFDDTSYLVVWLEKLSETKVEIRLRRISFDGKLFPPVVLATAPPGRAAGFPKVAVTGGQVLLAWRDERVRTAVITKQELKEKEEK